MVEVSGFTHQVLVDRQRVMGKLPCPVGEAGWHHAAPQLPALLPWLSHGHPSAGHRAGDSLSALTRGCSRCLGMKCTMLGSRIIAFLQP